MLGKGEGTGVDEGLEFRGVGDVREGDVEVGEGLESRADRGKVAVEEDGVEDAFGAQYCVSFLVYMVEYEAVEKELHRPLTMSLTLAESAKTSRMNSGGSRGSMAIMV